jgi:hypothetical protein
MNRRARVQLAAGGAMIALLTAAVTGSVWGNFTGSAANAANSITAAPDFVAPTVSRSVIAKTQGGTPGFIKQGGTYYVYADATDAGNPASGIASETANVSSIGGSGSLALDPGSFSIDDLSYNYRSASVTAPATLAAGTYSYSLTSTDNASNSRTQGGFTVTVDNTRPSGADVQAQNKTGGVAGKMEQGDSVTLTYSEPIDPNSVLAGWSGASQNIAVLVSDDVSGTDVVSFWTTTFSAQIQLGAIGLGRNDYVTADRVFGLSGTASTMVQGGNAITVTLGTASGSTSTAGSAGTMIWGPSGTATDRAGNQAQTTLVSESGSADREF